MAGPARLGRIQLSNIPLSLLILFGMWACYLCAEGLPFPHPALESLRDLGLFIFRTQFVLKLVFWAAVLSHVYEAGLAVMFARRLRGMDVPFMLFWFVQTLLIGYPSLMLIKEQRRQQLSKK